MVPDNHKYKAAFATWLMLAVLMVPGAHAADAPSLPPNRLVLSSTPDLEQFRLVGQAAGQAEANVVAVRSQAFESAWNVDVHRQPLAEYQIQLAAHVRQMLNKGDTVRLAVWARAPRSSSPDLQGRIGLVLEQTADPYDKVLMRRFDVGPDWQEFSLTGKLRRDFPSDNLQVCIRFGFFPQTVEVGGIELRSFGTSIALSDVPQTPMTYPGRAPDAAWRAQANERIESIRKSTLTIRVTDAKDQPIPGAAVQVRMTRQAFPFGCVYTPDRFPEDGRETADDLAYQKHFTELFNIGVDEFSMKWPDWENPAKQQAALHALQWMRAHNIPVRGHNLVWPGWRHLPADMRSQANDHEALNRRIADHIRNEAGKLAGQVCEWDVINEPYLNNDLMRILGDGAMGDWFKLARQADSSAPLYLNETDVPTSPPSDRRYDVLYSQIQTLQREGAPIGGLGMQAHFSDELISPAKLLAIYDRYSALGIPIRITELDIDTADEQLQADYFRDFLTASFSDPEINGILIWGFWEEQDWRPDAALFRKDWSIKPNGQVWKNLVMNRWRTNCDGTSSVDGTYRTRAFLGEYSITVTVDGRSSTKKVWLPNVGYTADFKLS
jgi:GH35 family endo-1,4-beta-xylanase